MSKSTRISIIEITSKGFAAHGAMELTVIDRLSLIAARGPFNLQMVLAGDAAQEKLDAELQARGCWGTMLVFRKSAMANFEVLAEIESILKRRLAKAICPVAAAIDLGPAVEGACSCIRTTWAPTPMCELWPRCLSRSRRRGTGYLHNSVLRPVHRPLAACKP